MYVKKALLEETRMHYVQRMKYVIAYGKDAPISVNALHKWAALYELVQKLGFGAEYTALCARDPEHKKLCGQYTRILTHGEEVSV